MKVPIISDIHFNNDNAKRIYNELDKCFYPELNDVDMVIIAGDLMDTKVQFDSPAAKYALRFLNDVKRLTERPIILLKGTKTHDYNIVDILRDTMENLYCISTKDTMDLEDGSKVLLLPEEYPKDWREYYKEELNIEGSEDFEPWDLIVFHGMVDFAAHPSCIIESERNIHSSVVFPSELLMQSAKICIGGHVHNMDDYKSIHYCKSFSRLNFGEEEDKGFIIYNGGKKFKRIVNGAAPIYQTVLLEEFYDPNSQNVQEVVDAIKEFLNDDSESHLRVKITSDTISDKYHADILLLREVFSDEKRVKIDMSHSFNKKKKKSEIETKTDEIIHESVINNEPIEKTIVKFSKEKFNKDIKEEDVIDIISK